jgi:hypothetical protein
VPGDKICLRLRISHSVNLGGVWAVFRRLPERGEELHDPYITLPGKHYLLSRAGPLRASEVYFEAEIYRERHLPGDYELEVVRAYPYGLDGRNDLSLEFEVGDEVCFRIAEELGVPSPRVTGWKFDWLARSGWLSSSISAFHDGRRKLGDRCEHHVGL